MNYTAGDIVDQVEYTLIEESTPVVYTYEEMVQWLNFGQTDIITKKPDANSVVESVRLSAGVQQTLPTGGIAFIRANRMMGSNGSTPGDALTMVIRETMDMIKSGWSYDASTANANHFMADPANPLVYWVWPPSTGSNYIELVYSKNATKIAYDALEVWKSAAVEIRQGYSNALIEYLLYRAFGKDTGTVGNVERSLAHKDAYYECLGLSAGRNK